ncbi:STAS-like domain-containing protein [Clostridium massiliamazoniense]|uniref:STAS-like domain-containing protein n=1 Tax=Clostridium massiliamazoniense TaxID=1347366 RepID=UPI0006D80FCC|nr:STAS-like domain-containing protein [Clostridium massiliamazoniense]
MLIKVKDFLGDNFNVEDAIVLRDFITKHLEENVELDFEGLSRVSTTFLTCLFNDLINKVGRDTVITKIGVKNLSNINDYSRVVKGTTF